MKAFQSEPQSLVLPNVSALAAAIGLRAFMAHKFTPPMKSKAGMVEIVVRPIVHGHALGGQSVPVVEIFREKRTDTADLVVGHIVAADLAVIVGKAVRETAWTWTTAAGAHFR